MTTPTGACSTPEPDATERLAYIGLAQLPGLGPSRLAQLLSRFGAAAAVLGAPPRSLEQAARMAGDLVRAIARLDLREVAAQVDGWRSRGIDLLIPPDPGFPRQLRTIPDPPVLLWARGNTAVLEHPALAIVGSRDHTPYGASVASEVATTAARAGIVVVSGMARGLDAVAHAAALAAGFLTIGVVGNGIDVVYPRRNADLYAKVVARGLLLTEHPPGAEAHPGAFARRNRLISGLARAVVVVEAADGSGTMLTVASALEQGREVLAVPGPILSSTSAGTNRLIRDGATPLLEPAQVLALFGIEDPAPRQFDMPCSLSPAEAMVFNALDAAGLHVDDVALGAGLPIGQVLATLLGLELGGLVEQLPGERYRRSARLRG